MKVSAWLTFAALYVCGPAFGATPQSFVNFETPHVHPVDLSPDNNTLAVCNTPDNHVWLYDVSGPLPSLIGSVAVGMDPVSVRFRTNTELWVVNHISDSVSIVDVAQMNVAHTVSMRVAPAGAFAPGQTPADFGDEPADVVFAGSPVMAYVTCSQSNRVVTIDPADPSGGIVDQIPILGEDPRALAVSADGMTVYAAVFESGNDTTILGGGADLGEGVIDFPSNVVDDANTPYGGVNPPPNNGAVFNPPLNLGLPGAPDVGLIVRKSGAQWLDDNGTDWAAFVTGANAAQSGRYLGWDLVDNDVAIIDASDNSVSYATGLMNLCMAIAVNPFNGDITVVGTDATNEIRFEPVITGTFTRVDIGIVDAAMPTNTSVADLNIDHLNYSSSILAQTERDKSIGDPRGILWSSTGVGYVTGMGSNNLIVIDSNGTRAGIAETIEVGEGPTGLALDEANGRLYVLNKFDSSLSVINTTAQVEITRIPIFDPSPQAIKVGRKHLYDTHKNSGLGQIACASCHVDSRMDRLAWDLGDPSGAMKSVNGTDHNLGAGVTFLTSGFEDFHPMKGPMTTQTLQDIIGKEPLHWRGDRDGLEEFNMAFMGLQGDDVMLTTGEMQEFEDFLATIHFPPNPFRPLDNTLPTDLPLPGHYEGGRYGTPGEPLPNGNAVAGLARFRAESLRLDSATFTCVRCHTLPIGNGAGVEATGSMSNPVFQPIPLGPNGEHHIALVSVDGSTNKAIKTPQLRNGYEKIGFNLAPGAPSTSGFGVLHDGSIDGLARFVSEQTFILPAQQDVADMVALMLSFSGGFDFVTLQPEEFPMQQSNDAHAAVGMQVTVDSPAKDLTMLNQFVALAQNGEVGLIAKGKQNGVQRGWRHVAGDLFQSDRSIQVDSMSELASKADAASAITFTVVPLGSSQRMGIDRDTDGYFDFDELLAGSDPLNQFSAPPPANVSATSLWQLTLLLAILACGMALFIGRRIRSSS